MTLIEVMAALLITTVGLLATLMTINIVIRGASFSRNVTEASVLAQSQLEQLVSLKTGTVGALPANTTETGLDANGIVTATGPYTRFTTWAASSDGLRRICTVQVTWNDALNNPHSIYAQRQQSLQ